MKHSSRFLTTKDNLSQVWSSPEYGQSKYYYTYQDYHYKHPGGWKYSLLYFYKNEPIVKEKPECKECQNNKDGHCTLKSHKGIIMDEITFLSLQDEITTYFIEKEKE